jgi:uncharacterized MAPEG superfamily protein
MGFDFPPQSANARADAVFPLSSLVPLLPKFNLAFRPQTAVMTFANLSTSTILLGSIAAAAALVYFPYLVVAITRFQVGFDISAPRAAFDKLPDYGKRATWAHQNSWEAFILYSVAALMAYATNQSSATVINCAIGFTAARLFYSIFYIINFPIGRSLMFGVGSVAIFTLMSMSITSTMH